MKRLMVSIVVLAPFVMVTGSLPAQTSVDVGFKGGVSFARYRVDSLSGDVINHDSDFKTGIVAGAFFTFHVSDYFAIQPEILFSQKGNKGSMSAIEITYGPSRYMEWRWEDKLNYLELPALLKVRLPGRGEVHPDLFVGPFLACKLSAKQEWESTLRDSAGVLLRHDSGEGDVGGFFKDVNFGLTFGGDLVINTKLATIVFDIRYELGLTDIEEPMDELLSKVGTTRQGEIKNESVFFMVGVSFPLRS
jgi:hypothetical protein